MQFFRRILSPQLHPCCPSPWHTAAHVLCQTFIGLTLLGMPQTRGSLRQKPRLPERWGRLPPPPRAPATLQEGELPPTGYSRGVCPDPAPTEAGGSGSPSMRTDWSPSNEPALQLRLIRLISAHANYPEDCQLGSNHHSNGTHRSAGRGWSRGCPSAGTHRLRQCPQTCSCTPNTSPKPHHKPGSTITTN